MIEFKEMTKAFSNQEVLKAINLQVKANAITGLVGKNGVGKTTFLKLLAGYLRPTNGQVLMDDQATFDNFNLRMNTVFIDSEMPFSNKMTLKEYFQFAERFYPNWEKNYANNLLAYFDLSEKEYYGALSKGKRQIFHNIIGLAARAALTIFDEPITGLDMASREDFYRLVLKDYLRYPRTILISNHHMNEMMDILEHLILIDEGRILLDAPVEALQDYALALSGDRSRLDAWSQKQKVIYKEVVSDKELFLVVEKESVSDTILENYQFTPVSVSDLIKYMTARKGEIDYEIYDKTV